MALKDELVALDKKDLDYYDNLNEQDKKAFSGYLMLRYASSVKGSTDLESYYLVAANRRVNINFWELNKHPKLQWLLVTTVSPGIGNQFHQWIAAKKKDGSGNNKIKKFLTKINPLLNNDEIDILSKLHTENDCKDHAKNLGWTDKDIKDAFK